jgi:hypothetical protein
LEAFIRPIAGGFACDLLKLLTFFLGQVHDGSLWC